VSVIEFFEFVHAIIPYEVRMVVYVGLLFYLYVTLKEKRSAKQESKNKANDKV